MRVYPLLYIVVFLLHSFTFCCIALKMMNLEVKARGWKILHPKLIWALGRESVNNRDEGLFRFAFTLLWLIHRWIDAVVKE